MRMHAPSKETKYLSTDVRYGTFSMKSQLMVMGENVLTKSKYLLWITSPALYDVEFTSISKGGGDFWASTPWPLGNMLIQAPSGGP